MLQEQLFANSRMGGDERRILLVLQALDTAGKGGIVKHVMGAVDPEYPGNDDRWFNTTSVHYAINT